MSAVLKPDEQFARAAITLEWSPPIPAAVQRALYQEVLELLYRELPAFKAANGCRATMILIEHDGVRVTGIESFGYCTGE